MNRPRSPRALFAILAPLAASVVLAACGGGGEADPQEAIDNATLQGIESAALDLSAEMRAEAGRGDVALTLSGAFQTQGQGRLPLLDVAASAEGEVGKGAEARDVDFEGGVTLLPNSAYLALDEDLYEIDPTTFSFVQSALRQAETEAGGAEAGAAACQEALGEVEVAEFVEGAEAEGGVEVEGETTTKVSGELDVAAALDQLVGVAQSPACRALVGTAGGLPSKAEIEESLRTIDGSVKEAEADVYVGEDGIVRRLALDATVAPGAGGGAEGVGISLDLTLSDVNGEQDIAAPAGRARPVADLFQELGINPLDALAALQGEGDIGALIEQALGSEIGGIPGAGALPPGE